MFIQLNKNTQCLVKLLWQPLLPHSIHYIKPNVSSPRNNYKRTISTSPVHRTTVLSMPHKATVSVNENPIVKITTEKQVYYPSTEKETEEHYEVKEKEGTPVYPAYKTAYDHRFEGNMGKLNNTSQDFDCNHYEADKKYTTRYRYQTPTRESRYTTTYIPTYQATTPIYTSPVYTINKRYDPFPRYYYDV
ncbi:unnamed protein product [Moneuplotes crassus]|uniref:Uncharacterized protein n=1 Tax=Euplotes crassus TaxID=5936 RepID=A0AAD2D4J2_EUPCR|nr:unnamed protein product [Moneuplotes crassus]